MKTFNRILWAAIIALTLSVSCRSMAGEVGNYPNASTPTGLERILTDQGCPSFAPCTTATTVNLSLNQIGTFFTSGAANYSVLYNNSGTLTGLIPLTTGIYCLDWTSLSAAPTLSNACGSGGGGVSTISVVTANGLSGTVANPTTTPAITLAPTFNGIAYSTGNAFQPAIPSNFPQLNQNTSGQAGSAANLIAGLTNSIPFQSAPGVTSFTTSATVGYLQWNGSAFVWSTPTTGNVNTSGSPTQYQTVVWASGTTILGVGPGSTGQAFVSNGSSANPSYSSTLSGVTSVNGTNIPASANLLVSGGALGTPSSGVATNLTGTAAALNIGGNAATATIATNMSGGASNQIAYQTGASTSSFITAPTTGSTYLEWNGTSFTWTTVSSSSAFNNITNGTNTSATMTCGSGCVMAASGSGSITATAVPLAGVTGLGTGIATFLGTPTAANLGSAVTGAGLVAGSNITITGSWPNQTITASSAAGSAWNTLTSGTNTTMAAVMGSGSSLSATGTGTIAATSVPFSGVSTSINSTATLTCGTGCAITTSGSGTNTATAVPVGGVTGLATGMATFLATPSSANLASTITNETGTAGFLVFSNAPVLTNPGIAGSSTGSTTIASANSSATNYTWTLPAVNDTAVGAAATQTLTNKSIAGSEINSGTVGSSFLGVISLSSGGNGGVTNTLPEGNGGTGITALTQYNLVSGGSTTANLIAPSSTVGEALISNGASAQPGYSTTLAGVTSVNGTTIPASQILVYQGSALGTPASGVATNLTGTASGLTVGTATNVAAGSANQIDYQTGAGATGFITAPTTGSTYLEWTGSAFSWVAPSGTGNVNNSGTPTQYQTAVWTSSTAILGVGPGTTGQAFVSNGASANPGFSATLSGVTSVNGTSIPASSTLLVNGGALGTPASGTATNLTGLPLGGIVAQASNTIPCNATGSSATLTACTASTILTVLNSSSTNAQTGSSYTGALTDANGLITMSNASANTFCLPPNSSVAYPLGTTLTVQQLGSGTTSLAPAGASGCSGSGVSIESPQYGSSTSQTYGLAATYDFIQVKQTTTNVWLVTGVGPGRTLQSGLTNLASTSFGGVFNTLAEGNGGTGLTALTQYSLMSGGSTTVNLISPSSTAGQALISNGSSAQPGYSAALAGVTSVNGTTIPTSQTLVYQGSALGTPASGVATNLTGTATGLTAGSANNMTGGTANQIPYQTAAGVSSFITAPTTSSTYLEWTGSAFTWAAGGGGGGSGTVNTCGTANSIGVYTSTGTTISCDTSILDSTNTLSVGKGMFGVPVALTASSSNFTPNLYSGNQFTLTLGSGDTIVNPTNATAGQTYTLAIAQPASGGPYSVSWGGGYAWVAGSAPSLATAANAVTLVSCQVVTTAPTMQCYGPVNSAFTAGSVQSPTAPNSTSAYTMQGFAGTVTPTTTGNVTLEVCGTLASAGATTATIGMQFQLSYGTGTAPSTNATLTGSQVGPVYKHLNGSTLGAATDGFTPGCWEADVTLTPGTTYWVDVAAEAIGTASDMSFSNAQVKAHEYR